MIRRLAPFFANVQKRLTKSPKVYVRDSGLLHFLAGLRSPNELDSWSRRGSSFEGMVIEEIAALAAETAVRSELFFWRTGAGGEVDLLIREGTQTTAVEIKSSSVVDRHAVAGLRQCMTDLGLKRGYVVADVENTVAMTEEITVVPWTDVVTRKVDFGLGRTSRR